MVIYIIANILLFIEIVVGLMFLIISLKQLLQNFNFNKKAVECMSAIDFHEKLKIRC